MKKFIIRFIVFSCFRSYSQEGKHSLELNVSARYDQHANYNSRYSNNAFVNHTTLSGISFGGDISYRTRISEELFALIVVGFYQLRVDHIKQSTPFGTTSTARSINYPDPSNRVLYSTMDYYYNNFQGTAGLEKEYRIKNDLFFVIGCEYLYYYTFSQNYYLQNQIDWKTTFSRPMGYGIALTISLVNSSNLYFKPQLIIPVFQNLKTDPVFLEEGKNIQKWVSGCKPSA